MNLPFKVSSPKKNPQDSSHALTLINLSSSPLTIVFLKTEVVFNLNSPKIPSEAQGGLVPASFALIQTPRSEA